MKIIQSAGGPLIGLDMEDIQLWSGVIKTSFFGKETRFATDYEAACLRTNGKHTVPCAVALLSGEFATGVLISMPLETALIETTDISTYIVQVDYSNSDWNTFSISPRDFDRVNFELRDRVHFSCRSGVYAFFDAAYAGSNVKNDCLICDIGTGNHVISAAEYQPDENTGVILYKIQKM